MSVARLEGFLSAFEALNQLNNYGARFSWFPLPPCDLPLEKRLEDFYAPAQGACVRRGLYRLAALPNWRAVWARVRPWLLHFHQGKIDGDSVRDAFLEYLQCLFEQAPLKMWVVDQRQCEVNPIGDVGWDLLLFETPELVSALYCGWSD